MGQPSSTNKKHVKVEATVRIEAKDKLAAGLNAIKTWEGMSSEDIKNLSKAMNTLFKDALLQKNIQPDEKRQLVLKYIEIWSSHPVLKNLSANLQGVNLEGANLDEVDLTRVDLTGTNLTMASLGDTNLEGANLSEANLTNAYLTGANLEGTNLTKANLTNARLTWANLEGANLAEADLLAANLEYVNLQDANMKGANLKYSFLSSRGLSETKNLTNEQKANAIYNADDFVAKINSILESKDQQITKDIIQIMPNLYNTAIDLYGESNDCKNAANRLRIRFPNMVDVEWPKHLTRKILEQDFFTISSFLAATTFLQGVKQEESPVSTLPGELITKIISELIGKTSRSNDDQADNVFSAMMEARKNLKKVPHQSSLDIAYALAKQPYSEFSARMACDLKNTGTKAERSILARIEAEKNTERVTEL